MRKNDEKVDVVFKFAQKNNRQNEVDTNQDYKFRTGYRGNKNQKPSFPEGAPVIEYEMDGKLIREYRDTSTLPKFSSMDLFLAFGLGAAFVGVAMIVLIQLYL